METNELANQVIEAMLEAVAVTDLDGMICYVNGEFERGSGWKRQEAVGKTVFELGIMAKEESRRLEDEIRPKLMKQGRFRDIETTAIRRDGTEFPVSMSWTLMKDAEGKATGIVTVAKDITELKKTEAGLRHCEEKWHSLVQNAVDTILIVDRDGKIEFINHTVAGIIPAEAIGATIYDYVPLEHHDRLMESLERVFETGQGDSYEISGVGPHGILSWYRSRVGPVKQDGKIVAAAIIATDISLRKRTEQALLESESKYRDLVEEMTDVIYTLDTTGNVTSVNRAGKAMFGRDPQEILGKSFTEWIPEDERPDAVAAFERVLEGEKVKAETVLLDKQGQRHHVEFTSTRILKDGRVTGTRGIIRDITERKKVQEALEASQRELAMRNKIAGIFLTIPDDQMYAEVLQIVLEVLESEHGVFGYIDEDGALVCPSMTREVWDRCQIPDKDIIFPRETWGGIWGRALTEKKTLYSNEPFHVPKGHIPLSRALTVPVLHRDEVVGHLLVGNKATDYNEQDKELLETVADYIAPILHARLQRDRYEREHLRADQALRESEERLRMFMDSATEGFTLWDSNFNLVRMNRTTLGMFPRGTKEEDLVGRNALEIVPNLKASGRYEQYMEVMRTGKPLLIDELVPHPKFGDRIISVRAFRVGDGLGLITADITERKRAEEEIRESRERYRRLFDDIADPIFVADSETGIITDCNCAASEFMGMDKAELIGRHQRTLHPPEEIEGELSRTFVQHREEKQKEVLEAQVVTKKGDIRDVAIRAGVTELVRGKRVVFGMFRDVTERKKAEQKLAESESTLRSMLNSITESALLMERDGTIVAANEVAAERVGTSVDSLIGRCGYAFLGEGVAKSRRARANKVIRTGKPIQFEDVRSGRNIHNSIYPVYDSSGKVTRLAVFAFDITEAKRSEQQLNEYRDRMTQAERLASVGTISAELVHRLAQPFTVIGLNMENSLARLQKMPSCPESVSQMLKEALAALANATSIVELFRAFARKSERGVGPVSLRTVAERIVMLLERKASRAKLALRLRGLEKLPPIYANEQDLEQLFFALVDNAIQAADGRRQRKLTVSGTRKGKYVELRFSDDCCGIGAKNLDRVFEPFFTTKPAGEGTGLGLCIVQHVADEVGGKVRVESKLHKGSTFIVSLPIGRGKTS